MSFRLTALLTVLHTIFCQVHFDGNYPFVWTKLGGLRGIYQDFNAKKVAAFLGVPFAQPPLGELRFDKPQEVKHWWNGYCPPEDSRLARPDCNGKRVDENDSKSCEDCVRDAKKPANSCMLTPDEYFPGFRGSEMWNPPNTSEISEDCLYLNIWVPQNPSGDVLVWIFGGGFFSGSPSLDLYNGKVWAAEHNVIVVSINYRLGPFGFLYLDDSSVPGNMGLLDQQMALKWISENIREFGGKADQVTLFGESAGSASVTAHLLAKGSHDYFSKIICLSGSVTNLWATRTPQTMKEVSLKLAKNLRCLGDDNLPNLGCLRQKSSAEVQLASDTVFGEESRMSFPFVPINEDNVFFQGKVSDLLNNGDFKKGVSAVFGAVNDEGTFWLPYYLSDSGFGFNSTLPPEDEQNQALITDDQYKQSIEAFASYFVGWEESKEKLFEGYRGLFPSREKVDSSANPWPKWMGVMHGYEIEYMFGQPLSEPSLYNSTILQTEQDFSNYIIKMWADFARTGAPLEGWMHYESNNRKGLVLNKELLESGPVQYVGLHAEQCELI